MRERRACRKPDSGFSLVEMMVALLFISVLMGGMATVFRSSLTTFYTSAEKLSSVRRNRASLDLLSNDINSIGLYLQDLQAVPTGLGAGNPPFYVLPQQPVSTATDQPQFADQLFFYLDMPFQFQGRIGSVGSPGANANTFIQSGENISTYSPDYTIDCGSAVYAQQISSSFNAVSPRTPLPLVMARQDSYSNLAITSVTAPAANSSLITVTTGASGSVSTTGIGSPGGPPKSAPIVGAAVTFFVPAQMVRYSIQMLQLDPASSVGVPCLVRDQGNYSATGFNAIASLQQVIAENVTDFRVFMSVSPGYLTVNAPTQAWVPFSKPGTGLNLDTGWNSIYLANLNTQLGIAGRQGHTSIDPALNPTWFRDIPMVVRVDITTRTARERTEYNTAGTTTAASTTSPGLAYRTFTRSLMMVPRHFGLPLTN